jgi:hypothetical protein
MCPLRKTTAPLKKKRSKCHSFCVGVNLWVHPMQKGSRCTKDRGLNENQHERMQQDLSDYREQLRQAQVQQ